MRNRKALLVIAAIAAACNPGVSSRAVGMDMGWVNDKLVAWNPPTWKPMNFTMQLGRASYGNIMRPCNTLDVLAANLAFCESLNPTSIRIDLSFDAFAVNNTNAISKLDSIVALIKAYKRKLIIADAAREFYWKHQQLWSQFVEEWTDRVRTLAQRYQPDYYIVIKEPGWYFRMIADPRNPAITTPATWINLLDTLNKTVKSVSPDTKTGMALSAGALSPNGRFSDRQIELMVGASLLGSTDFIWFDIYVQSDYGVVHQFIQQHGTGGKEIWFPEMGSGTARTAFDPSRAELDQRWVQVVYEFAAVENASEISMFF